MDLTVFTLRCPPLGFLLTPAFGDTMRPTTWGDRKIFGRERELRSSVLLHTFALLHLTHDLPAHCMVREDPPGDGMANPFQYSCLEKSHGQRSLAGYRPWGHKSQTPLQLNHHQELDLFVIRLIFIKLTNNYKTKFQFVLLKSLIVREVVLVQV